MNPITKEQKLAEIVRREFEVYSPPVMPSLNEIGNEGWEETNGFWGNSWDNLNLDIFNTNPSCMSFFVANSFPYFFGCLLYYSLLEREYENGALDLFFVGWSDRSSVKAGDEFYEIVSNWEADIKQHVSPTQIKIIREFVKLRGVEIGDEDNLGATNFIDAIS